MRQTRYIGAHAAPTGRAAPAEQVRPRRPKTEHVRIRPLFQPPRKPRKRLRKQRIFLLAVICAALLLGFAALFLNAAEESVYESNMKKALQAVEQEDWDRALRHLRLAAACDENDDCLLLMASCYEKQGNLDRALELLRRTSTANPDTTRHIHELEEQKAVRKTADRVELFGAFLPQDTRELELNARGLVNADLDQIVRLYALDALYLADNRLTDITALAALGSLDILDLRGNHITNLDPVSQMPELRSLTLDGNPIHDLTPLYSLSNLRMLSLRGCNLGSDELQALADTLPACAILSEAESPDGWNIRLGGLCFPSDVKELNLSGRGIRDISALALCKELQWLNLSRNEISELQGLMNLPLLGNLDISDNQIVDLRPLIGLTTLRTLKAGSNDIVDISPLSAMTGLISLDLSGNPISDFSVLRRLTNLNSLRLNQTGLHDADLDYLGELVQLTQLTIDDNPGLSNEAFGLLQSHLRGCTISHSALIYTIQIENRSVRSDVMQLDLSGEGIVDLSGIERLSCLESLNLSRNRLSNLYVLQLSASRSTLKTLDLSFNEIKSIAPVGELSALENLNLYGNPLESVQPLMRLTKLKTLNVGGCGLNEKQLQELRESLPDCSVTLEAG